MAKGNLNIYKMRLTFMTTFGRVTVGLNGVMRLKMKFLEHGMMI